MYTVMLFWLYRIPNKKIIHITVVRCDFICSVLVVNPVSKGHSLVTISEVYNSAISDVVTGLPDTVVPAPQKGWVPLGLSGYL